MINFSCLSVVVELSNFEEFDNGSPLLSFNILNRNIENSFKVDSE